MRGTECAFRAFSLAVALSFEWLGSFLANGGFDQKHKMVSLRGYLYRHNTSGKFSVTKSYIARRGREREIPLFAET